jgi:D-hexose-6-phosphate mutarotase
MSQSLASLRRHEIVGPVAIEAGAGGLPRVVVRTPHSTAEIYVHGAHVTRFQKTDGSPILFVSRHSVFAEGQAIRGGVPVCYPWFGARDGGPSHGTARLSEWNLVETAVRPDGAVVVRLAFPADKAPAEWSSLHTVFTVTVSDTLTFELATRQAGGTAVRFENCLHTYFQVLDIERISVTGLARAPFDDFAHGANGLRRPGDVDDLRINQETNRVYPDSPSPVEIVDHSLGRVIRVEKTGSLSTVVWNPWTTQKMPGDFGPGEYREMVCVESGNVKQNAVTLAPGESSSLSVTISSRTLG